MAYQTRGRDPLLDSNMQAAIEKRSKELIGISLIVLGLLCAAMVGSYTPDDPNWLVSTDAQVQNWLGRSGASIAAPLMMVVGLGAWAIAIVLMVWGLRFVLHWGTERALGRLIFAPIGIALLAIYAETLQPGAAWSQTHSFGLGGMFGYTVMGFMLTVLPIGSAFALKLMALIMAVAVIAMSAFVLGFTRSELRRGGRFLLLGVVILYAGLMTLLGKGASNAVHAARDMQARTAERRARQAQEAEDAAAYAALHPQMDAPDPYVSAPAVPVADAPEPWMEPAEPKGGLLSRMPSLIKQADPVPEDMPEPELVETYCDVHIDGAPSDARIKAKITDVIKSRVRQSPSVQVSSVAPLTKGRGRGPAPLVLNTDPAPVELPPEPPLTAAAAPLRSEPPLVAPRADIPAAPMMDAPEVLEDFAAPVVEPLPLQPAPAPSAPSIPVAEPRRVVEQVIRKPVQPSTRAKAEAQPQLSFEESHPGFELPPLSLLESPDTVTRHHLSDDALEENARMLESVLDDYGVKGEIVAVRPGPVVTMYELEPAPGLKASRVIGLGGRYRPLHGALVCAGVHRARSLCDWHRIAKREPRKSCAA